MKNLKFNVRKAQRLLIALCLLFVGAGHMKAEYEYGKYNLYLDISQNTGWKVSNGYVGFHFSYNENSNGEYIGRYTATLVEGNIYCVSASSHNNAYIRGIKACRWSTSGGDDWNTSNSTHPTNSSSHSSKNCIKIPSNGWSGCTVSWDAYIPTVSSVALSYNITPSSGSGTSGDPYIVPTGTTVRVTATPTSVIEDSQMTMKYQWDSGSWGTSIYKDLSCSTNNIIYSTTVTCKNEFNSNKGNGASATIYFKAVSTPTLSLSAPSTVVRGDAITLTATPSNATTPTIKYQYSTSSTFASSTQIASTTSTSQSWTVPAGTDGTTYYLRAQMTINGTTYSSSILTLTAYGKKTIHVKNSNNWNNLYLYAWDGSGDINGAWPGKTGAGSNGLSCTKTGGQWWDVTITSQVSGFILNANVSGDANQTADLSYSTYTNDRCLAIGTGSGKRTLSNTAVECPSAPDVTTAAAGSFTNSKATLNASDVDANNDAITAYGFKWGTTTACSNTQAASNLSGTAFSYQLTGLTAGQTYHFKAYATNGQGTTEGSRSSFVVPYKVTVTKPTGCSSITNSGTNYTSSTITVTATKADGYTFSSWSTTNGTQTSTSSTSTTNTLTFTPTSDNATITAVYTENMTNVNLAASPTGKGSFTIGGAAATSTTAGVTTTRSVTAVPATGYCVNTSANVWSSSNAYITLNNVKANPVTVTGAGSGGTSTLTATFTPITYTIQFNGNGSTSGSMTNQTGVTYDASTAIKTNAFSRTGYTFQGWATSQSRANAGTVDRTDGAAHGNLTSTQGTTVTLWAVWQATTYTVNLDRSGTGYGSGGSSSVTATYDADMPAMTSPTADNGYAFMGYFTAEDGGGTMYYNANGTSAKTWDIDVNPTTLYAWFKKAEITELTFDPAIVAPNTTIKVTPTIAPTPTGDTHIEWRVLYDNNNPLAPQPTMTTSGTGKQFTAMAESGIYKVEATLRTGTVDGAGTVLHTKVASFQVAGDHTITVRYKCGDYVVAAPTSVTGKPLDWSSDITAPAVTGYTFQYWTLGDGITLKDGQSTGDENTQGTNPIKIKATYDGTLTANYVKKQMIYFNNTLGWSNVYVYFYDNGDYWDPNNDNGKGAGAQHNYAISGHSPHWYHFWGAMTRIEGTNIWYLDYQAMAQSIDPVNAGLINGYTTVAFTKDAQGYIDSSHDGYQFFDDTEAAFRTDFNHALSMYVPQNSGVEEKNKHDGKKTKYYNRGYWMNYPENTGYWLKIFDKKANDGTDPIIVKDIPFEFTADYTMPMDLTVDLEAGKTYGFKLYRVDNMWYGNNSTMTANTTNWKMDENTSNCGLQTTAAGNYKFNLYFLDDNNDGEYRYRVGVTYPVGAGDFRIVYTDGAKWSQSTAHTGSWSHPSAIISKNSSSTVVKRDTVSFYWAYGSSPAIKSQKCSSVGTGTVSWGSTTSINVSSYSSVLNKKGVYNFIFEQPQNGGSISLVGVEPYTGDFYIRTDCAGSTKWDNYKALDHMMQYSDYAANNEDFTHYYAHWVERSKNIKFVIANDYSPCVSDTLVQDVDVNFGNMESDGTLKSDGAGEAFRDKYSANIRFMYNVNDNKLSRAYISSATDIAKKFLVMRGNNASGKGHIFNEAGQELTTAGGGKIADLDEYEMSFVDDQNFIYETKIKANPTALIKLYAKYCGKSQELKGDTTATFNTTDNHAIEILGGTYAAATKELMRIVYDFKTNRLVCAWLPSDSEISGELDINADVMIIREHQDEAQQIKFANTGDKLTEVKSVYGVMRFNRWTLANKDKSTHNPLASPKSNYERQIYFISFPFDVKLGDIFGLSAYDDLWWIEYYDGAERAEKGYFQETKSFWKFMENTPTAKLEANKGYILKLDAAMLNSSNTNIWTNNIEQVELFFPSASEVEEIEKQNASITLDPLPCTKNINPAGSKEPGQDGYVAEKDRRKRDSHWYCIGVPSYANYSEYVTDAEGNNLSWSTWGPTNEGSFPFLYTWNMTDNTLSPTASAKYGFKTMNAYMVQYAGTINWAAASAPKSIAARRNANWNSSYMFRLELQKEGQKTEQTLVNLRDDDNVSAAFDFNYDLSNEGGAIYTTTSDLVTVAGNCLPLVTDQQTTVPVGVIAKTTGEYTFAMPDGTEGLSVTLVDNFTGAHTNLALGDYTVELEAGTYEERFTIVIDPRTTTTAVETIGGEGNEAAARKVFINGLMYIQRGEHLYDAQGRKVE